MNKRQFARDTFEFKYGYSSWKIDMLCRHRFLDAVHRCNTEGNDYQSRNVIMVNHDPTDEMRGGASWNVDCLIINRLFHSDEWRALVVERLRETQPEVFDDTVAFYNALDEYSVYNEGINPHCYLHSCHCGHFG